jgi:GR25 family glycosyltransferase involved in LPS biosynthesis
MEIIVNFGKNWRMCNMGKGRKNKSGTRVVNPSGYSQDNQINEFFDEIYLINLQHDIGRFDNMVKVFDFLDVKYLKWVATTPDVFSQLSNHVNLSKEYLACLTSHLTIIRDAYDKGLEKILIMEDDIIPIKDFHNKFNIFIEELPKDWDMLYLSYIPLNDDCSMWTYIDIEKDLVTPTVVKAKNFWSGMCYGLSRNMMSIILQFYKNVPPIEIDRLYVEHLQKSPGFKIYGSYPQLFAGVDNYSNNTKVEESIFTRSANPMLLKKSDFFDPSDI